ncbi:MAG: hypothetical protein R3Y33_03170 [Clostridia bacterium]
MENDEKFKSKYDFSEDISSGMKIKDEKSLVEDEDFFSDVSSFSQDNSYNNKPSSFFQSFFKKIDDANDKFSTISFRLKRGKRHCFNNGEPVSSAVKKFFFEIFLVVFVLGIFVAGNFGLYKLKVYNTTASVTSFAVDRSYIDEQAVTLDYDYTKNSATSAINAVADCAGYTTAINLDEDITQEDMKLELEDALPDYYVSLMTNMTDYELLDGIYQSLKNGLPVMVMIIGEDEGDFCYVVVEKYNANDKVITVKNQNGIKELMSVDKFLTLTRFEAYDINLTNQIGLIFGKYNNNTAFFFNENVG